MTIENKLCTKSIPVSRISYGESFIYNNCLHIKIDRGYIQVSSDFTNVVVNLENNRLNVLGDDVLVTPVKSKNCS